MKLRTSLAILVSTVLCAAVSPAEVKSTDLRNSTDNLPYRIEVVNRLDTVDYSASGWVTTRFLGDINGDTATDKIWAGPIGVHGGVTHANGRSEAWQTNIAPEFTGQGACGSIDGLWDVDADGRPEVVVTSKTPDRSSWQILVLDALTGDERAKFRMSGGVDSRPDGQWDGYFRVYGVISVPGEPEDRRALVVFSQAGFDIEPRQVYALAVDNGEVLWRFACGPKPIARSVHLMDLDGDSRDEIAFIGGGVDNLAGRRINGTSDDRSVLFVLASDGSLRWMQELGAAPASGELQVADLDHDGRLELFVVGGENRSGTGLLEVYAADGARIASLDTPGIGQFAVLEATGADGASAFVSFDGSIRKYSVTCDRIELEAEAHGFGFFRACLLADLVEKPGRELLVSGTSEGRAWLLDSDLVPLACSQATGISMVDARVHRMHRVDGTRSVAVDGTGKSDRAELLFRPTERSFPWGVTLAGFCLVGGLGGGTYLGLRRRRRYSRFTLRELRLQLLGRLQLSGHGAIGALSSLRRLNWHLGGLEQGYAAEERVAGVIRDLCEDIHAVSLEGLRAALELAELADLQKDVVGRAGQAVSRLGDLLEEESRHGFGPDRLTRRREELQELAEDAERAFMKLRQMTEAVFCADPVAVVRRSLSGVGVEGIEVRDELDGMPRCRIDPEELAFIVDNLVENAVRAMRGQPVARLTLAWKELPSHVILTVSDTGCGIAPDELELVMKPGHSKRQGGGLGLPRSREILGKYGGNLVIRQSRPGEGTVMALTLPSVAGPMIDPDSGVGA